MEDFVLAIIISAISSAISAAVGIAVFFPLLLLMSKGLETDQSSGFGFRSFIASQMIFWGSLVFVAWVDPPSVGAFVGNGIPFLFNLVLIVFATRIGMRAAIRIRNSRRSGDAPRVDDLERMKNSLDRGQKARDVTAKITDILK
ncbi:hypothetical protein [Rubrivivax sp. A210]|uniref:hypothetical protein n=1 Tax=Rubrivivax sp. A210 TaxID=2772301 RepID=UPI00191ABD36|nr:hypothetical protein [Rubrivivax sp. A210]